MRDNQQAAYTANNLNQYTERTVPDTVDILGSADSEATVTVNLEPVTRQGAYFHKALEVANDTAAAYENVSVVGVRKNAGTDGKDVVSEETGNLFVPQTPEQFTYDADGNMTSDGRFTYSWNCENRLPLLRYTLTPIPRNLSSPTTTWDGASRSKFILGKLTAGL